MTRVIEYHGVCPVQISNISVPAVLSPSVDPYLALQILYTTSTTTTTTTITTTTNGRFFKFIPGSHTVNWLPDALHSP